MWSYLNYYPLSHSVKCKCGRCCTFMWPLSVMTIFLYAVMPVMDYNVSYGTLHSPLNSTHMRFLFSTLFCFLYFDACCRRPLSLCVKKSSRRWRHSSNVFVIAMLSWLHFSVRTMRCVSSTTSPTCSFFIDNVQWLVFVVCVNRRSSLNQRSYQSSSHSYVKCWWSLQMLNILWLRNVFERLEVLRVVLIGVHIARCCSPSYVFCGSTRLTRRFFSMCAFNFSKCFPFQFTSLPMNNNFFQKINSSFNRFLPRSHLCSHQNELEHLPHRHLGCAQRLFLQILTNKTTRNPNQNQNQNQKNVAKKGISLKRRSRGRNNKITWTKYKPWKKMTIT